VTTQERRVFHAAAPVRLDFAGGWTDVPPFSTREGGLVVNAAIGLSVRAEVELGGTGMLLRAEDLGEAAVIAHASQLAGHGPLPLLRAALRMFPAGPCTLRTISEVPAGSGLGSSGALDVALVSVLAVSRGEALTREQAAAYGWELEAVEAGLPGGRQDQCAAAFGGFHLLGFEDGEPTVEPLDLAEDFLAALEGRILLCFTGRSRVSGETITRVMSAYERGESGVVEALRGLKETASRMAEAMKRGDGEEVGTLLQRNWELQQALDSSMRTEEMARLEAAMTELGALGGKAAGAGAGGCMFFLFQDSDELARAKEAAGRLGATVLPVEWTGNGVRTW
jgi:D-glycero-alpha-D-manno-heptose-7-phosphate kinase